MDLQLIVSLTGRFTTGNESADFRIQYSSPNGEQLPELSTENLRGFAALEGLPRPPTGRIVPVISKIFRCRRSPAHYFTLSSEA